MRRRLLLSVALALVLLAVAFLLVVWLVPPPPPVVERYARYQEAVAAGMRMRGWLPEFVPASARNIYESHDPDSNMSVGGFVYDPDSETALAEALEERALPCSINIPDSELPEWPMTQTGVQSCELLVRAGFEIYEYRDPETRAPRRRFVVLVRPARREAVFWTVRSD